MGVEHVALQALGQLGLVDKLTELGINGVQRAAILGNVIGRMAAPGSELATWDWLHNHSALGELLECDFQSMSHMSLYRASNLLMRHRSVIEEHVFGAVQTLFGLGETVTLYDLTNTYFEGELAGNAKARRGRSEEKRRDCALITLGLVLDGSGFGAPRPSRATSPKESRCRPCSRTFRRTRARWSSWMRASPPRTTWTGWQTTAIATWWCAAAGSANSMRTTRWSSRRQGAGAAAAEGGERERPGGAAVLPLRIAPGQGDGDG